MDNRSLDWTTDTLLAADARGEVTPAAVLFLLRLYAASGRDDVREAVARGLALGLDAVAVGSDPWERCQWLGLFAEAASVSDDARLPDAIRTVTPLAIDDLEQAVRAGYEPGEGVLGAGLVDQLRAALALLTAFDLTGRLPYPMLAEELVQVARRRAWDDARGMFQADFGANAVAARVLCRLTALHRDPEYTAGAIVVRQATYREDAERTLESLAPIHRGYPGSAADYGIALLDCFALTAHPH